MSSAIVLSHLGLGDIVGFNPAINYLSIKHNEVYIFSKKRNYENVKHMYKHNSNIYITCLSESADNNQQQEFFEIDNLIKEKQKELSKLVIYTAGNYNKNRTPFVNLPDNFYNDINVEISTYDNYFEISKEFYDETKVSKLLPNDFIFTVSSSSTVNIQEKIKNDLNFDFLVLNTTINFYKEGHKYYELANKFINLPFFDYVPVIKKAKEIRVIDSAFSLLCKFISNDECQKFIYNNSGYKLSENFFKNWIIL